LSDVGDSGGGALGPKKGAGGALGPKKGAGGALATTASSATGGGNG